MLSRRIFERGVFNAAASVQTPHHTPGPIRSGIALKPYLDPLPIPPVLRPQAKTSITMRAAKHQAHRDLPPSTIWGYNGIWPGPTIETHRGQPLIIHWTNHLPEEHFLPLDPTIHGSEASLPEVRTVAHLHGAFVSPDSDGYPDAWFTSSGKTGPRFRSRSSSYPNEQPAATLWYHDHCIGITRLNLYAGLAGFYLIRDAEEDQLNLPTGAFDIPLMLQDRLFQHDGSLLYPKAVNGTHPVWIQEFFGDTVCVNGKATPYLEVEPRRYRFRILNASNARFYQLRLHHANESGQILGKAFNVPLFEQIAADGGLLPVPVSLRYLLIAPGERIDVIVDFSPFASQCFTLDNSAPAPYTMGGEYVPTEVMLFKVSLPLSGKDTSSLPKIQIPFAPIEPSAAIKERILPLTEIERPSDGYVVTSTLGNARWHDPITENPKASSIEIWSLLNTTADMHPIHLHLVRFQVLNRQPFDVAQYLMNGEVAFLGPPIPPEPNEYPAWKDTVKAYPGHLTRIIQKFDLPANSQPFPHDDGFLYVWHCHILEHEDNEMMRPYKVRL